MLNRKHKLFISTVVIGIFCTLFVVTCKNERQYYKIGPMGEYGEITIMKDYMIFGHYSSLGYPTHDYIKLPIEYDYSVMEFEVTTDSTIQIASTPDIESYELSSFKKVNIGNSANDFFNPQRPASKIIKYKGMIRALGYGLIPSFCYHEDDTLIIMQWYQQTFFMESTDRWCYYDTIPMELFMTQWEIE